MRKRHRLIAIRASVFCCLLFCSSYAVSQSPAITVSHAVAPVNQLSVSDFDFRNSTTPKWLFTISIVVEGGGSLDVQMVATVGFTLPNGNYPEALRISTESFTVNGTRSISNLDLDKSIRLKAGREGYSLDNTAKRTLEETALPTGQIPAGTYDFHVVVTPIGGTAKETGFSLVLSNPTSIEMISPIDGDRFASPFPLFQWLYDGPSSRISVFEQLPGQTTLEEAASGIPHYSTISTSNSMQYPSSGTRSLEPGKTYVWFVEGLSGAAGGTTVALKSSLRSFTVASNGAFLMSSILDDLARALPQYQSLFDEIKAQGFTSATTLRLNGSAISVSDLQNLLNRLRLNPDAVMSVELE